MSKLLKKKSEINENKQKKKKKKILKVKNKTNDHNKILITYSKSDIPRISEKAEPIVIKREKEGWISIGLYLYGEKFSNRINSDLILLRKCHPDFYYECEEIEPGAFIIFKIKKNKKLEEQKEIKTKKKNLKKKKILKKKRA